MKLTALFTLFLFLQVFARSEAQKINLDIKNKPLEKVLVEIKKQSGFSFVYEKKLVGSAGLVNIKATNEPLKDVLTKLFMYLPLDFKIADNFIVISPKSAPAIRAIEKAKDEPPPGIAISGKVTDEEGKPLQGASVKLKGSQIGTNTDEQGNFSLTIPDNKGVLIISYVGYKTAEIPVVRPGQLSIKLGRLENTAEQIVVIGYGTQKKADMTGAVSSLKGADLSRAAPANLTNALVGKMTGVIATQQSGKPGYDDPIFYIRGKSTFGDNSALILVDGIERSFSRMDPNEIESVTILKDAASAAVYGARAANGVILITTKRGKEGPPHFSYNGSYGFQQPTVIPAEMNAYDYATYLNMALQNIGNSPRFSEAEIAQYKNGSLPSTNWWNTTLKKNATLQQHAFSINGGNQNQKYFIDLGYLNQKGLYDLSYFKRYNVRLNFDTRLSDRLRVGLDLAARTETMSQSAADDALFNTIINSKPTERPYTPDSIAVGGLGSNGQGISPIGLARKAGYNNNRNDVFQGTLQVVYEIPFIRGLNAKGSFAYDRWHGDNSVFNTPFTYYQFDKVNKIYTPFQSPGQINLTEATASTTQSTLQLSLNYDRSFHDHHVTGLLLYEQVESGGKNFQAYRDGFISPAIDQLFAGGNANKNNNGSASQAGRLGYVGRVNYNYRNKYLLQANFRLDGSFNFPKDKRWGFFPAVSAGWKISEENFMKNVDFISSLKLRASYGKFGNDRVAQYQYLTGFQFGPGAVIGGNYQQGLVDMGIANPNITWEQATNTDIGLEIGLLHGKLTTELDYFYKRTRDILLPKSASIPASFGAALPFENIGIVDNRGVEASLQYRADIGRMHLQTGGNITYAISKVIFMDEAANTPDRLKRTGHPFDQVFGYEAVGIFQSQTEINNWPDQDGNKNASLKPGDIKYLDYNKDGKVDGNDIHNIGKSQVPQFVFGYNLGLGYKQFSITANLQGASGFQQHLRYDPFNLESNALNIFKDSWTPTNPGAKYPALYAGIHQNNRLVSTFWLYDASYVRLKSLEIAYTFKKYAALQKLGVKNLRIYLSGSNLLTWSKLKDFDPEAPAIDPDNRAYYYPQMKSFNAGLNLDF